MMRFAGTAACAGVGCRAEGLGWETKKDVVMQFVVQAECLVKVEGC